MPPELVFYGGMHETRTRDLRYDRSELPQTKLERLQKVGRIGFLKARQQRLERRKVSFEHLPDEPLRKLRIVDVLGRVPIGQHIEP